MILYSSRFSQIHITKLCFISFSFHLELFPSKHVRSLMEYVRPENLSLFIFGTGKQCKFDGKTWKKKIDSVEFGNVETTGTELEGLQYKKHGLIVGRTESKRKDFGSL